MSLVTFNSKDVQHDLRVIKKAYTDLPAGLVKRQVKAAMKTAMKPWMPEFRAIAPVWKKLLPKTLKARKQLELWHSTHSPGRSVKRVSYKPGNLKRSVQAMSGQDRTYGFWGKVGFGRSKGKKGNHALLLNDGTKPRETKAGKSTGRGPATRFAEPLANRIRQQGAYQFSLQIGAAIERGYAQLDKYLAARLKSRRRKG